jgi:hypothetical protein
MNARSPVLFILLAVIVFSSYAFAEECPPAVGGGSLCTANDLIIVVTGFDGPAACTEGEEFSGVLELVLGNIEISVRDASERYDIGVFVGDRDQPVFNGDSCSFR